MVKMKAKRMTSILILVVFTIWNMSMPIARSISNYYFNKWGAAVQQEFHTLEEREKLQSIEKSAMQRSDQLKQIRNTLETLPYRSMIWLILVALLVVGLYEFGIKWTLWTNLLSLVISNLAAWGFVGLITLLAPDTVSLGVVGDTYRLSILLIGKKYLESIAIALAVYCIPLVIRRYGRKRRVKKS